MLLSLMIRSRLCDNAANCASRAATVRERFAQAKNTAVRWAELDTQGQLPTFKETSIDTQFLDQIFGYGLGYQVKTASPDSGN